MKQYYILVFVCLFSFTNVNAQSFLNGSLEPEGMLYQCAVNPNNVFNANMGNAWSIGTLNGIYVGADSCGVAAAGLYYVGLKATSAGYNAIVLKLSTPMTVGNSYVLNFYAQKRDTGAAVRLRIGFSNDSTSIIDTINTLHAPADSLWTLEYDSLVANVSAQYITIQAVTNASSKDTNMAYVDEFSLINTTTGVASVAGNSDHTVDIYPNPFLNSAAIIISSSIPHPYRVMVYDMLGRLLVQNNTNEQVITVTKTQIPAGIFLMRITDGNGQSYYRRLISE